MRCAINTHHAAVLACVVTLLVAVPAAAQDKADDRRGRSKTEAGDKAEEKDAQVWGRGDAPDGDVADREETKERILRTIRLPRTAEDARETGVPEEEVGKVIESARRGRVPAADAQVVMEEGAGRAHDGDADNFGSFVNAQLERGLTGRELAAAIHAEKAARGQDAGQKGAAGRGGRGGKANDSDAKGLAVQEVDAHDEQGGAHLGSKAEGEAQRAKKKGQGKANKARDAKPPQSSRGRNEN